jgi:DNA (cytosine-5)-methyltransferase 1
MKVLDLFSGIGGMRLGFEMAGHETIGWVEWDKHTRKSYEAIHQPKGEWTHHDIRTVDARSIPRADVWTFGFPCQDLSVAGKQLGFAGERSSLFFTVTQLLREIKEEDPSKLPSYLLAENVKNFLSVNGGWDFLLALAELDEVGYDCEWQLLNSKGFGVPQNRERVFIVGHLRNRRTRKVFPIRGENTKTHCKLAGRLDLQTNRIYLPEGLAPTLTTMQGGRQEPKILVTKNQEKLIPRDSFTCLDANYHKGLDNRGARTGVLEIRAVLTPDRKEKRQNGRRIKEPNEPMFTLTTQDRHGIYDGYRIRKLTPRECFRLQGFPDWAFDRAKEAGVSDSQLYRQAGNSVTTTVIYAIAREMEIAKRG